MLEKIKYINHMNEVLELDNPKMFVQENGLHDFSWNVSSRNDRISGLKRKINSKTFTIIIKGESESECRELSNRLFDVMEKDALAAKYGKLYVGEFYLKCYVVESKKTDYQRRQGYLKVSLKITTDYPYWVRENTLSFGYGIASEGTSLDFNRDFPYDFTSNLLGKTVNNNGIVPQNFRMMIYGACEKPSISIGGHSYTVNVSVEKNEYVVIDSISKTIILKHADGTETNCFNLRDKDSYIFEKIPVGSSLVDGNYKFDLTLLEERSEPKWI